MKLPPCALPILLSGCAVSSPIHIEQPAPSSPVGENEARVTVIRDGNAVQYSARKARVNIDGTGAGHLGAGSSWTTQVVPGTHTIVVDMWDVPGRCELTFAALAGTTTYLEISPRSANLAAGTPGAIAPYSSALGALAAGAAMLGGMAIESSGKKCAGAFSITVVEQPAASLKAQRSQPIRSE